MPTPRKTPAPLVGGQALKQAIHVARARAGITSDMALSGLAGVHYDTLMNWYGDRTVPRPAEVKKVATVLDVPYADLIAAYEGVDPAPPPLQDAIAQLVEGLERDRVTLEEAILESRQARREMHDACMVILAAIAAIVAAGPAPRESDADRLFHILNTTVLQSMTDAGPP